MPEPAPPPIVLALQGGGTHGAFTWGVLDRLLREVSANRLRLSAVSGTSAGAFNAALLVSGLVQGGPNLARRKLANFWTSLSQRGLLSGNALFFGASPFGGFNLDWSPAAIALEAAGLVVSPYANPFYTDALAPLVNHAQDLLLILVNPFQRTDGTPRSARAILSRTNELTFNASIVLEVNAIEAVNSLLAELERDGVAYAGRYKPVRFHAVRNDAFAAALGTVSKSSTSAALLSTMHDAGYQAAESWVTAHLADVGARSSLDVKTELMDWVLNAP